MKNKKYLLAGVAAVITLFVFMGVHGTVRAAASCNMNPSTSDGCDNANGYTCVSGGCQNASGIGEPVGSSPATATTGTLCDPTSSTSCGTNSGLECIAGITSVSGVMEQAPTGECAAPGNGATNSPCGYTPQDAQCASGTTCTWYHACVSNAAIYAAPPPAGAATTTTPPTVSTATPVTSNPSSSTQPPITTSQPPTAALPANAATSGSNCAANGSSTTICNPLPDATIGAFITRMVTYVLSIIAAVAVVMIVVAGFRMVVNSGNEDAMKKAQGQITAAVIGLAITVLAYAAVAITTNVLKGL